MIPSAGTEEYNRRSRRGRRQALRQATDQPWRPTGLGDSRCPTSPPQQSSSKLERIDFDRRSDPRRAPRRPCRSRPRRGHGLLLRDPGLQGGGPERCLSGRIRFRWQRDAHHLACHRSWKLSGFQPQDQHRSAPPRARSRTRRRLLRCTSACATIPASCSSSTRSLSARARPHTTSSAPYPAASGSSSRRAQADGVQRGAKRSSPSAPT